MDVAPLNTRITCAGLLAVIAISWCGCAASGWNRWTFRQTPSVLSPDISKTELIAHLNRGILGDESHPGLSSWRSGSVRLRVDGVPMGLPASIAVKAPTNLRLLVSNPISGGQEVDIGSNEERFWIWSKEQPQVMTARHEDVSLALEELQMPVHIHPKWLMEVFGVVPLNADEYEMSRSSPESGLVTLVAVRQSPLGEDVERVMKVDLRQGHIVEHSLQLPGGTVLARAQLDRYTPTENGPSLPLLVTLEWPDARMRMVMDIRNPEVNSPAMARNVSLWQMPGHGEVVDIGQLARSHRQQTEQEILPAMHSRNSVSKPGQFRLPDSSGDVPVDKTERTAAAPAGTMEFDARPMLSPAPATAAASPVPEWARDPAPQK